MDQIDQDIDADLLDSFVVLQLDDANCDEENSLRFAAQMSPQPAAPAHEDKKKLIQQQLVLLLHAHKCMRQKNAACALMHCQTMKDVIEHLKGCQLGNQCERTYCSSSLQIIKHWRNCSHADCAVCMPLKSGKIDGNIK
jgi:hypothetical protein